MPQDPLITREKLALYGAPSDFLAQFRARPLVVEIVTGGALGTMTFRWRLQDDDDAWSDEETSEAGSTWSTTLADPAFATLTFAAGTYVADKQYVVRSSGAVVAGSGALDALTATRIDIVASICDSTTKKAVTWLSSTRVVPPIVSVDTEIEEWLAAVAIYALKSRQGSTPPGAGLGDENLRLRALDAEENLKAIGRSAQRPPGLVDSSSSGDGGGFTAYPESDDLRGW